MTLICSFVDVESGHDVNAFWSFNCDLFCCSAIQLFLFFYSNGGFGKFSENRIFCCISVWKLESIKKKKIPKINLVFFPAHGMILLERKVVIFFVFYNRKLTQPRFNNLSFIVCAFGFYFSLEIHFHLSFQFNVVLFFSSHTSNTVFSGMIERKRGREEKENPSVEIGFKLIVVCVLFRYEFKMKSSNSFFFFVMLNREDVINISSIFGAKRTTLC